MGLAGGGRGHTEVSRESSAARAFLPGVLITTDVYPPLCGGSGWSAHALALTLRDHGHRVRVLELDAGASGHDHRLYEGVSIDRLGIRRQRRSPLRRLGGHDYAFRAVRDRVGQMLRQEPELRIVHGQHLHSGPGAIAAALANGRAAVLTLRDYWPVCLHGTTWWGGGKCAGCTRVNLSGCMQEVFGLPAAAAHALRPWARRRLATRAGDVSRAHRVLAVSETLRERLRAGGLTVPIDVVPNIIDPERSANAAAAAIDAAPGLPRPFLLAAGKLGAAKGFDALLEELAAVKQALPLVVAGAGPAKRRLEEQARELGLETRFVGWIDGGAVLRLMRDAEAVILPSLWEEPLARVLLEAMSVGTPVISWPVGSSREVIDDGVNGWIVSAAGDLGRVLSELRAAGTRSRVAAASAATVRRRFAPAAVYPQLMAVYEAAMRDAGDV